MKRKLPDSFNVTLNGSILLLFTLIFTLLINTHSAIPTISPQNNLLNAQSNYIINYFAFKQFQTSSFFQIDFSQSDIAVPEGRLNVTASLNSVAANQSLITSNCVSKVCTIRLGVSFAINTNVQIRFGSLTNPKYTASQRLNVLIYIGVNNNQTQTVSISSSVYLPMPITVNSVTQSDYGVGTQDVTYVFNISFTYVPKDPQISIQVPTQVGYTYLNTEIVFYGTVQNITPFLTNNMIILSLSVNQIVNPNGFMLITLQGFRNPRFIGTSSVFNVTMVQKKIATTNNCATCRVALLYPNSSKVLTVSSTTPGDIIINIFNPSNYYVSQKNTLTIGIKIVAPIPQGGKFRIILPQSVIPVMPISCQAIYGFTIINPASCTYNQSLNTIQTVNFSIPFLQITGDAIIKILVYNPKDSRQTQFNFQTLDDLNRKIGKSRQSYKYSSNPLLLNGTISKNITELESIFTLTSSITLSQALNKTTDAILVILPPSQFYNLSAIVCSSSSLDLGCTKSYENLTKNLFIKFNPPCAVCNVSSVISFKISNLINPSFINDDLKNIQVQTVTNFGAMQDFNGMIELKQKVLTVTSLSWQGNQQIGSLYQMKIQFQIPKYIQTYGGYLLIKFNQNQTYIDAVLNGTTYQYPQSVIVLNQNNQSYNNSVGYHQKNKPYSVNFIKIKLCINGSFCGSNLTIMNLRKSFYPLQQMFQTFKATTLADQSISTILKDTSNFVPLSFSGNLNVSSTISVANTISNYIFKFRMNKLPFESGLKIDLSSKHKIQSNGRCFVQMLPTNALGYGIDCQIFNSTSIVITYTGDIAMMTLSSIQYTVTIVNVLNPPSIMPITHKIQTTLSGKVNAVFSTSYSISQPYTLVVDKLQCSNRTYSLAGVLSTKLTSGYYLFDQMKVYVPKENYRSLLSFNDINTSPSNGGYGFSENSTHFILDKIYSINNNSFTIQIMNAFTTMAKGKLTIEMYVQGFLSSKGIFDLPRVQPVYLYTVATSNNRFVGQATSLQFDIRRVNNFSLQKTLKITFNSSVLSSDSPNSTLFKSQSGNNQLLSYTESLSLWNSTFKTITLNSLRNMKFVPNNITLNQLPSVLVQTLDENSSVVSRSIINLNQIVPNKYKDSVSYTYNRANVQSGNNTDITIDFTTRYPQKAKYLRIQLPLNQNKLVAASTCSLGSTASVDCMLYSKNLTNLLIQYPSNQTRIVLKNVLNLFPSSNNLTLTLMTELFEIIEVSTKPITPAIDFDPIQFSGVVNTSDISSTVKLDFTLKEVQNSLQVGSKIIFVFPDRVYSKFLSLNSKDCQYQIMGIKYSGCQYINDQFDDGKQWLQYVYLNNLGPAVIPGGSIIKVTLYLTNPLTAYVFNQRAIYSLLINPLGQQTSKGILLLSSLYPTINSFTSGTLNNISLLQSNKNCNQQNIITLTMQTTVTLAKQTYAYITLPSIFYEILPQTGLQIQSTTATFINIKRQLTECSAAFINTSGLCIPANSIISVSIKVMNDKYSKITDQVQKISIYLFNDNSFVTKNSQINLKNNIPSQLNDLSLVRTNPKVSQNSNCTLSFTLESGINLSTSLKVSLAPLNSTIKFLDSVSSSNLVIPSDQNNPISLSFTQANELILFSLNAIPLNIVRIVFQGTNPSFAPNSLVQSYQVKIYDENYIYYSNSNISLSASNKLLPLAEGVQIFRSNSNLAELATYSISGSLPQTVNYGRIVFNESVTISGGSTAVFKNINIGQFLNPASVNWDIYESLSIMNNTHILYMNKKIKTLPLLQSLPLPANTLKSIKYNKQMRINTQQKLTITFNSPLTNSNKINVKLPSFFKTLKQIKINSQTLLSNSNIKVSSILQSRSFIQMNLNNNVSMIELTFFTLQYQKIFLNDSIILETQYPTKSFTQAFEVSVYGSLLTSSLKMSSYKVNTQNNIELSFNPLNKASILTVYFPIFLNQQLNKSIQSSANGVPTSIIKFLKNNQSANYNLQFSQKAKSYYLNLTLNQSSSLSASYNILLDKIKNPLTNQPFSFITQQSQILVPENIFAHSRNSIQMNELQRLKVKSITRNTSKIGLDVQIRLQIQIPTTIQSQILVLLMQKQCIIQLPQVQVVRSSIGPCQIYIVQNNTTQTKQGCSLHPTLPNAIITTFRGGNNKYIIRKGYKNMLYSVVPKQEHKPYVYISDPFKMAQSLVTQTEFLVPVMTSGSLNLNKLSSSSLVRLQKTKLSLNLTLQNIQQVDCLNLRFQKQNYIYKQNQIKCSANNKSRQCWFSNQGSLMVNLTSLNVNNLILQINGLANYIRQTNFTIRTLKFLGSNTQVSSSNNQNKVGVSAYQVSDSNDVPLNVKSAPQSSFAMIDVYYSSPTDVFSSYSSNTYNTRVINSQNYVSNEMKQILIIFDDDQLLPSALDKSLLKFNITTNINNCSLINGFYSTVKSLKCKFTQSMTLTVSVSLFHNQFIDYPLSIKSFNSYIYPSLHNNCQNQMCDLCSNDQFGQQKCFSCRQNYYQYQNGCTQNCPSGYSQYPLSMSCQQCSSSCATCFGIYPNNCLNCQNANFVSDNGQCSQNCYSGYKEKGYCLGDNQCFDQGCRLCSTTGFCYQCLPDYDGQPVCKWKPALPATFMTYFILPVLAYAIISCIYFFVRKGLSTLSNQVIFSMSILQFLTWCLIIPAFHTKQEAILLISMIVFRIILGIVAYQTFYKKQINSHIGLNQEQSLIQKQKQSNKSSSKSKNKNQSQQTLHFEQTWLSKFIRFVAHVNGVDTYESFKVLYSSNLRITHNNLYLWINTGNKMLVTFLMFYVLSQAKFGDLTIMPIISILSTLVLIGMRLGKSSKVQEWWAKFKNIGKN